MIGLPIHELQCSEENVSHNGKTVMVNLINWKFEYDQPSESESHKILMNISGMDGQVFGIKLNEKCIGIYTNTLSDYNHTVNLLKRMTLKYSMYAGVPSYVGGILNENSFFNKTDKETIDQKITENDVYFFNIQMKRNFGYLIKVVDNVRKVLGNHLSLILKMIDYVAASGMRFNELIATEQKGERMRLLFNLMKLFVQDVYPKLQTCEIVEGQDIFEMIEMYDEKSDEEQMEYHAFKMSQFG